MATETPTTTLNVPAKPAAITAANVAALAGTAAAVAGPVGWAIAGAAAVTPVAVHGLRRARQRRRTRATTSTAARLGRAGVPGLGRSRAAAGGRAGGAGVSRTGTTRAGSPRIPSPRAGAGRGTTGSSTGGAHRRGGLLPRLGFGSSAASPGSRTRGGSPTGRKTGGGRLGRMLRLSGKQAAGFARGLATRTKPKTTARQAYKDNRERGTAVALGAATRAGIRRVWRSLGRWFRRWILGRKPKKKTKPKKKPEDLKTVSSTVDRGTPGGLTAPVAATEPQAAPGEPIRPGAEEPSKENTMSSADTPSGIREAAGRMWANADAWTPRGMLVVVEEYHDLPKTLEYFRATVGALMDKSMKKFPVDPAIAQQIGKVVECLDTAAAMARKVPEAVETIHKHELDRLRRPRVGEEMWDRSMNGVG